MNYVWLKVPGFNRSLFDADTGSSYLVYSWYLVCIYSAVNHHRGKLQWYSTAAVVVVVVVVAVVL